MPDREGVTHDDITRKKRALSRLVAFYRHQGTDHRGRSLDDIRAMSVDALEATHDFIQWLFPLPEPSSASADAPLLTPEDIRQFNADRMLRDELSRSLAVMLRFYGFASREHAGPGGVEIVRATGFAARGRIWLHPHSHNFLRITRILRALHLLGCADHAIALLGCLEDVYAEFPDTIGPRTIAFWRSARAAQESRRP
ncbi:MAG: hypothetical protein HY047_02870 [Acidobacteria bacterium]|nr:hypothetical protein [Acidobacteriota bacterium]